MTPGARPLAAALAGAEVVEIAPRRFPIAKRHQPLFLDRDSVIAERAAPRRWVFRHDRMAFAGRDLRREQTIGWADDAGRPFAETPYVSGDRELVTPHAVYRFDADQRRTSLRYTLPVGERFAGPPLAHGDFDVFLSDRALHLFSPGTLIDGSVAAVPIAVVPFEGQIDNLDRALVARNGDGYLVSYLFGRRSERDLRPARQSVMRVSPAGAVEVLVDAPRRRACRRGRATAVFWSHPRSRLSTISFAPRSTAQAREPAASPNW